MEEYLQETKYCDFGSLLIQTKAKEITQNLNTSKEKAIALFNWVRDNIIYKFDYWNVKASETLEKGTGMCTNKSNLLIALLRSCQIPAGYGILQVNAQEYFGPIIIPMFKPKVSAESTHIYTYVFLNNRWVKCDSSVDLQLSQKSAYFNQPTTLVEWDGENDSPCPLNPEYIFNDSFPSPIIDNLLEKPPDEFKKHRLRLFNIYLNFIRSYEGYFNSASNIQPCFLQWLKCKKPFFYLYYYLVEKISPKCLVTNKKRVVVETR